MKYSTNLLYVVQGIIRAIEDEEEHVLLPDDSVLLETIVINFVHALIEKYIKGSKEHGGSLAKRDLEKEMYDEIIDLVVYKEAQRYLNKHQNRSEIE